MEATTITPPIVLFLDDGVNVFDSPAAAEQSLEAFDIKNNPEWRGFDARGQGIRLEVIPHVRKFLFMAIKEERVKLRFDQSISLDATSDTIKDQMRDYLFGVSTSDDDKGKPQLSEREMFDLILQKFVKKVAGLKNDS